MKLLFFISLLLLLIFTGCKSSSMHIRVNNIPDNYTVLQEDDSSKIIFEMKKIELDIDPSMSVKQNNGLYKVHYKISINTTGFGELTCSFYDENNFLLYTSDLVKVTKRSKPLTFTFDDFIFYSTIKYTVSLKNENNSINEYEGFLNKPGFPDYPQIQFGPVITESLDKERVTSLLINLEMNTKNNTVESLKIIPPSEDFFWELQYEVDTETSLLTSNGKINFSDHKHYIENGIYIVQLSLGTLGIIQKPFQVIDIYGNEKGPNYGFMVPIERNSSRDRIELILNDTNHISDIELFLYSNENSETKPVGSMKTTIISDSLLKKDVLSGISDSEGKRVKLKYNENYYYKVVLTTNEINSLQYLSTSEMNKIIFYGFNIFNF